MATYRKKPVLVSAWKVRDVLVSRHDEMPSSYRRACATGQIMEAPQYIQISTLEGSMRADLDDWLICGVNGEFYPCKPDVFEKTYEPAE